MTHTIIARCPVAPLPTALDSYVAHGMALFPCHTMRGERCTCGDSGCPSPAKHPRTPCGLLDATTDQRTIAAWLKSWPDANWAVETGERSGANVLDVDPRHGGLVALARLEAEHGPIPATWRVRTGGGGLHLYFEHLPGMRNSAARIGPGLDVRADGGYVLLPPSVHASGRRYEWVNHPDETPLARWPAWLAALAMPPVPRYVRAPASALPAAPLPVPAGLLRFAEAGASEGQRNQSAFWLACRLVQECGPTAEALAVLEAFGAACAPPLDGRELEKVWASARRAQTFSPQRPVGRALDLVSGTHVMLRRGLRTQSACGGAIRTMSPGGHDGLV